MISNASTLTKHDKKSVIIDLFDYVWTKGQWQDLLRFYHPNVKYHFHSWGGKGRDGDLEDIAESIRKFAQHFKPPRVHICEMIENEHTVTVRWSMSTENIRPEEKEQLTCTSIHIYRFYGQKISEAWSVNLSSYSYDF